MIMANDSPLSYADALERVTAEDLARYPGKLVAVSLTGKGIVASGETLEELAAVLVADKGTHYPYAVAFGPRK